MRQGKMNSTHHHKLFPVVQETILNHILNQWPTPFHFGGNAHAEEELVKHIPLLNEITEWFIKASFDNGYITYEITA